MHVPRVTHLLRRWLPGTPPTAGADDHIGPVLLLQTIDTVITHEASPAGSGFRDDPYPPWFSTDTAITRFNHVTK